MSFHETCSHPCSLAQPKYFIPNNKQKQIESPTSETKTIWCPSQLCPLIPDSQLTQCSWVETPSFPSSQLWVGTDPPSADRSCSNWAPRPVADRGCSGCHYQWLCVCMCVWEGTGVHHEQRLLQRPVTGPLWGWNSPLPMAGRELLQPPPVNLNR